MLRIPSETDILTICADGFKSKAKKHYIAIIGRYITNCWELTQVCLGVQPITGSQDGENIKKGYSSKLF